MKKVILNNGFSSGKESEIATEVANILDRNSDNSFDTNDGAITYKRYNIQKDCHAVAPVLSWDAGGVAFSKVVLDYDFVEDK